MTYENLGRRPNNILEWARFLDALVALLRVEQLDDRNDPLGPPDSSFARRGHKALVRLHHCNFAQADRSIRAKLKRLARFLSENGFKGTAQTIRSTVGELALALPFGTDLTLPQRTDLVIDALISITGFEGLSADGRAPAEVPGDETTGMARRALTRLVDISSKLGPEQVGRWQRAALAAGLSDTVDDNGVYDAATEQIAAQAIELFNANEQLYEAI